MIKKYKVLLPVLILLVVVAAVAVYLRGHDVAVLNPAGTIAAKQHNLIVIAVLLSLIVVVPVYFLTFLFAWRYREGNHKAKYSPDLDHSRLAETIWWLVPGGLILILSVITWHSSRELDPFKSIAAAEAPMTIQVVALDWKWLFIYPKEEIATVNYVQFPERTPVDFEITADAPMNSFWIPKLGGQIYAMSGMRTHLHLMADGTGSYQGSSANVSGEGFADMHFTASATSRTDYDKWASDLSRSPAKLTDAEYIRLARPSRHHAEAAYTLSADNLFDKIMLKYMVPGSELAGGVKP